MEEHIRVSTPSHEEADIMAAIATINASFSRSLEEFLLIQLVQLKYEFVVMKKERQRQGHYDKERALRVEVAKRRSSQRKHKKQFILIMLRL
ncbi:hypothetical protein L1987_05510 [Smallanthus sonchifolius]|uniref:Uncharacterized protein n=1 Tax=Smallanthus sonchifolius TaxID=185202 RepID=A0ACB9JVQ4_9ASTR|nr:hypothetical protein L1987_05510 [Smallanthus sonchifolius]